ncbi:T-complex protein 1 subunit beta [Nematocida ausubeli]|nr:T-complex protein 1 subunit beta [Nematocida ausubeli]KAI5151123.1 T-complex protein 1 subunit beta [Nematocida ausubeli]
MAELLKPGATQEKADEARTSFLVGAITVSNMVKSTLGPRGMLKLLYSQNGQPIITNDGATVLKNILPSGASSKILINSAKEHGEKEGDGTTTLTVLTGGLLHEADKLIFNGYHPYKIMGEYRSAHKQAIDLLRSLTLKENQADRLSLAKTTLSSKFSPIELEALSNLAISAASKIEGSLEMLNIIKVEGGEVGDSYVHPGLLLECDVGPGQKESFDEPRVLIINTSLDTDKVKIFGAKASVSSPAELEKLEAAETLRMRNKVESIARYADVIVNRQIIYDYPTQEFTRHGKISIERADFTGVEMLAKVLHGRILSTFDNVSDGDIGRCSRFEKVKIQGRSFCSFTGGLKDGACTVVIRGSSQEIQEECERSLVGAIKVLVKTKDEYVCGGGSAEAAVAQMLQPKTEGERAYARALLDVTRALAENAGIPADDLLDALAVKNAQGVHTFGVGPDGAVCMDAAGVRESLRLKEIVWSKAAETAEVLLRCDGNIKCRPRERVHE